jgi:pimeloyl-ACP methyl ester carboxylesterase
VKVTVALTSAMAVLVGTTPHVASQVELVKRIVLAEGQPLVVWEKRAPRARGTILLVHGRTWSGLPAFDLHVPGERHSLMDALVARGYSAYAVDLRGYGSTPRDSSGWDTPDRSVEDVAAVLAWIAATSSTSGRPALLGWSNGATLAILCAQRHPERMSTLILTGLWKHPDSMIVSGLDPGSPDRRPNTAAAAASDFIAPGAMSEKAIGAFVAAALAADPVRADWRQLDEWNAIDPAKVVTPTLLVQGEFDPLAPTATQAAFFSRLGTGDREWVVLAGGDHAALIENTQPAFVAAVVNFLNRPIWGQ